MSRDHTTPAPLPTASFNGVGGERLAAVGLGARAARSLLRLATALLAVVGAVFVVVDCTPLANMLATPLLRERSSEAHADVAVVLAGGRYVDGSLNQPSIERTIAGVRLYHQGRVRYLLFSGADTGALMAKLARELGVPGEAILLENQSIRTYDGALYSAALIRQRGFGSVILVTSALHLRRARLTFAAAGVPVAPVRASEIDLTLVSGTDERICLLGDAVHEYVGLVFYRLKGWI